MNRTQVKELAKMFLDATFLQAKARNALAKSAPIESVSFDITDGFVNVVCDGKKYQFKENKFWT